MLPTHQYDIYTDSPIINANAARKYQVLPRILDADKMGASTNISVRDDTERFCAIQANVSRLYRCIR